MCGYIFFYKFTLAKEQAVYQEKLDALRLEVDLRDRDIKLLQQNMKDAESILVRHFVCI